MRIAYKPNYLLSLLLVLMLLNCKSKPSGEAITIDINNTGDQIEKYIYGQFIEHLGKCIYGGIWAEMLEDRKFYYPIEYDFSPWAKDSSEYWNTGEYTYLDGSPWEMIGKAETVKMDVRKPFTGEHSALIKLPGDGSKTGIRQGRITVLSNNNYTGHVVLSGSQQALPITVQLSTTEGKSMVYQINDISDEFKTYPFEFTSTFTSNEAALEIFSNGSGVFNVGTVSLMPSDNLKGWRPDVIALLRELNSPVYRWPGGNFVSGYNWMDGIGDRDQRPPRKNPAWKGVEPNDVGIHEFMELMEIIDSEPFIAVNTGLGTVEEVANEIEYCNGSINTAMGKLRAENGHPDAYKIKWWALGNEMYGNWQLGHMPLEDYVQKHNQMAEAIWNVDPEAKLIGVGAVGEWSKTMLEHCAENLNLLSEHIYCQEKQNVSEHISQIANSIRKVAEAHREYRKSIPGLKDKNIRIAMDEWNYWYGDYIYGELGVRYHLKDALGIAKGLHEYFRNSDIFFMANYAQTVNVIGCIKTTPTTANFATTGLALKMYRQNFGTIPISIDYNNPDLDISAALSSDKKKLTIAAVNSSDISEIISFDFKNIKYKKAGKQWLIHHSNPEIYNEPDQAQNVSIIETAIAFNKDQWTVPGYSNVLVSLEIK